MVSGWLLPSPWLSPSSTPSLQEEREKKQGWGWGEPLWVLSTQGFPRWVCKVVPEYSSQGLSNIIL